MLKLYRSRKRPTIALSNHSRRAWVWTAATIVLVAVILRLVLNFRYPLAPATDGAYYPMQTWWLIEHGRLMFSDLPLIFWLNAAVAYLIETTTAVHLDVATMFASRLIDGVAEPWVAVPILMFGYVWSGGRHEALLGCAAAAVLAVMSPPIMRMASDFQKNSLGLVWMVLALWSIREAMAHRLSVRRWGLLGLVVAIAGLTHIGAFGVTCVMLGATAIAYRLTGDRLRITRRGVIIMGVMVGLVGALILVMTWLEPRRTVRMLSAPWHAITLSHYRLSPPAVAVSLVVYGLLALVLRGLWLDWREVQRCDRAVVFGAAVAEGMLVFPFLEGIYAQRFLLMTPVPGAVLIAFVMSRRAVAGRAHWPAQALAVAAVLLVLPAPFMTQGPAISVDAADELRGFREYIGDPTGTLVVAPHGVEFWAGLLLHTPVRMVDIPEDAFTRYVRVLMVQRKAGSRDRMRPPQPGRDSRHPGRSGTRDPQRPPAPSMRELTIPPGAKLVHGGTYFNLYEVPSPG